MEAAYGSQQLPRTPDRIFAVSMTCALPPSASAIDPLGVSPSLTQVHRVASQGRRSLHSGLERYRSSTSTSFWCVTTKPRGLVEELLASARPRTDDGQPIFGDRLRVLYKFKVAAYKRLRVVDAYQSTYFSRLWGLSSISGGEIEIRRQRDQLAR